jgi:TPR repeat protein
MDLYRLTGDIRPAMNLEEQGDTQAKALLAEMRQEEERRAQLEDLNLRKRAEANDPDAQFQLYQLATTKDRLVWACRSADNGNAFARFRIAEIYEHGLEGVSQDNVRAQVWYRLAAQSGHAWGDANADRLAANSTATALEEVQRLLQERERVPGQCESELEQHRGEH